MKHRCLGMFITAVLIICSATADAETITLKAAYYQPDGHVITELGREVLKDVEKSTQGRVKFVIYANSTLLPTTEMAAGVDEGTAFVANWYMPYMSKTIPLFELETQAVWTNGYKGVLDAYENGINDLYTEALHRRGLKNIKVAGVSLCLWRVLGTTKKPVRVPSDIVGMKIRSVGAEADMFRSMGASPVNITTPQTYEALARGIADGATNSAIFFVERRWLEYVKYMTSINLSPVLMHIIYNTRELDKLEAGDRIIVEKAMKALASHTLQGLSRNDIDLKQRASKEYKVQFIELTPQEHGVWLKEAAKTTEKYKKSQDPMIQKALKVVYKYNPENK
jgi:TRAP-type C4-dicarboxylate transport system substrate-binding protein